MGEDDEYRCFIGNLSWSTSDRGLKDAFRKFGNLLDAKVVVDKFSGRSKGFGFVTFDEKKAMEEAIDAMNGMDLDGRAITVDKAQPQQSSGRDYDSNRPHDRDRDRGRDRSRSDREYGGGRGSGGGECFKCGKPGHFARECPSEEGRGGRYGGKKSRNLLFLLYSTATNLIHCSCRERRERERSKMYGFTSLSTESDGGIKGDIEEGTLYPGLGYGENQLRWGFIRKVYGILAAQILLTTLVSAVTVLYTPINDLLRGSPGLLLLLVFLPFVLLWPLHIYQRKHPLNFIFLGLFTASLSLTVGVTCANTDGRIVLEALLLTSAVVSALTGYTFWASKKGKDFSFLGPILFTSLFVLILTGFMQMFFPLGSTTSAVYSAMSAIIFCGYIIYDTDNLIKRFTYDEYIWASVTLYLDVLNLFLTILRILRQGDN